MIRWEYYVLKVEPQRSWLAGESSLDEHVMTGHLNHLGNQGWELVTNIETNAGHGQTSEIHLLFKRIKG